MHNRGEAWNLAVWGIVAMTAISFSGGCSANHYAVYRKPTLSDDSASAIIIDAQQRAILASPVSRPSANNNSMVMYCAEPSPDALMVLSSALAASGSGSIYGKAEFQAQLRTAMSEAATQLGNRSETIQLLRDASFRLCESRMDGFITNGAYPVELNRLQDGMVTLLAIERLASPNERSTPASVSAPKISGELTNVPGQSTGAPSSQPSTTPPNPAISAPAANPPKPAGSPAPAPSPAVSSSNDAVDSAPQMGNSRLDQNRDTVGNAPKLVLVKESSAPAASATGGPSGPSDEGSGGSAGENPAPRSGSSQTSSTSPPNPQTGSESKVEPPVSPAVADAVRRMVSIYLYKNLEESCVTLAATELQANFQIAANPNTARKLDDLVKMENNSHIWTYCRMIFDKFKLIENVPAANVSPASTTMPPAASAPLSRTHRRRKRQTDDMGRNAEGDSLVASDK